MILQLYRQLRSSTIRSHRDINRQTLAVTAVSIALAFACDFCNQMIFFVSWPVAFRSWALTILIAAAVSAPISRVITKGNFALYRASRTDPLTGLLNRRALFDGMVLSDALVVLMIADVDRFKTVNDTYGHLAGDTVLCTVANLLQSELGDLGRVGRLGGEEFALICHDRHIDAILERLDGFRALIAGTPMIADGISMSVTISAASLRRDTARASPSCSPKLIRRSIEQRRRAEIASRCRGMPCNPVRLCRRKPARIGIGTRRGNRATAR